jgi:hypothetical protein
VFQDATAFFSRGTPNLATVIPAMDHIDNLLTTRAVDHAYDPPIRVALAMGKKTLNRYYALTDASEVYRIAMGAFWTFFFSRLHTLTVLIVLHPRHKLTYFAKASWESAWIATAREIVRVEFDRSYADKPVEESTEDVQEDLTKV